MKDGKDDRTLVEDPAKKSVGPEVEHAKVVVHDLRKSSGHIENIPKTQLFEMPEHRQRRRWLQIGGGVLALVAVGLFVAYLGMVKFASSGNENEAVSLAPPTGSAAEQLADLQREDNPTEGRVHIYDASLFPNAGTINLTSTPEANMIFINGKKMVLPSGSNLQSPLKEFRLPPGKYKVLLRNTTMGMERTEEIELKEAETLKSHFILQRPGTAQ